MTVPRSVQGASPIRSGSDAVREPEQARAEPRKLRALIVEDELLVAWHLESLLQEIGICICMIASRGLEAVERAREFEPDVILMDVNLQEGIDGVEAARRIRATSEARIVFVTAYANQQTLNRIQAELPGAPVLGKPTSSSQLKAAIGSLR